MLLEDRSAVQLLFERRKRLRDEPSHPDSVKFLQHYSPLELAALMVWAPARARVNLHICESRQIDLIKVLVIKCTKFFRSIKFLKSYRLRWLPKSNAY